MKTLVVISKEGIPYTSKRDKEKWKFVKVIHNWLISFDARQDSSEFDTGNEDQQTS